MDSDVPLLLTNVLCGQGKENCWGGGLRLGKALMELVIVARDGQRRPAAPDQRALRAGERELLHRPVSPTHGVVLGWVFLNVFTKFYK